MKVKTVIYFENKDGALVPFATFKYHTDAMLFMNTIRDITPPLWYKQHTAGKPSMRKYQGGKK